MKIYSAIINILSKSICIRNILYSTVLYWKIKEFGILLDIDLIDHLKKDLIRYKFKIKRLKNQHIIFFKDDAEAFHANFHLNLGKDYSNEYGLEMNVFKNLLWFNKVDVNRHMIENTKSPYL